MCEQGCCAVASIYYLVQQHLQILLIGEASRRLMRVMDTPVYYHTASYIAVLHV